ncbi:HlyD family efflux transporter periplasmic adaptor subunit [Moorena sp. SIO3H5]|uniref:HlyD family efflux transporter periplasmic adaptor subunit n=1 Tax=Moorena sp. SIO3H5 TaxID=2607834 RepID=UPI0013BCAB81|nr:HlyD family efflux transporter periplasmic adaptor subunit [Moorena sp. SIO3H5]NEO70612.1 HlyD family efflux transporter periplasmic adaptor subunit [Moorena sp. SIO3H5]
MITSNRTTDNSYAEPTTNEVIQEQELSQPIIPQQPSVFLKQPSIWSRAILWGLVGITTFGITWASVAKIEKVIPAQGKLEPQGDVKEVQASISGVVAEVLIKDGELVKPDDVLIRFDMTSAQAQLVSLEQIQKSLIQENQFYRAQIGSDQASQPDNVQLNLPVEVLLLIKNRANLVAENKLYRVQVTGADGGANLTSEQQFRLQINLAEFNSRVTANKQEIQQLENQLGQTKIQLANARNLLSTANNNLVTAQTNLATEQEILTDFEPLLTEGAVPKIQYRRQKQEVGRGEAEVGTREAEVGTQQAEVNQLIQEQERIRSAIAQAKAQLANTIAASQTELQDRIAVNQQRIADIDSQLGKQIVENDKRIAEIDSQISQIKQNLKYHEITAPVAGKVFELKARPGFVTTSSETILEIVPNDELIAEVYITNKDRGFVKEGMEVDVRIDSFNFSEFGDIKGKLISIGADALEPDQIYSYYRFPAKIALKQQFIDIKGNSVPLASGMSVSVNIKERKRRVITIFTGFLTNKLDSLKGTK